MPQTLPLPLHVPLGWRAARHLRNDACWKKKKKKKKKMSRAAALATLVSQLSALVPAASAPTEAASSAALSRRSSRRSRRVVRERAARFCHPSRSASASASASASPDGHRPSGTGRRALRPAMSCPTPSCPASHVVVVVRGRRESGRRPAGIRGLAQLDDSIMAGGRARRRGRSGTGLVRRAGRGAASEGPGWERKTKRNVLILIRGGAPRTVPVMATLARPIARAERCQSPCVVTGCIRTGQASGVSRCAHTHTRIDRFFSTRPRLISPASLAQNKKQEGVPRRIPGAGALFPEGYHPRVGDAEPWICPVRDCQTVFAEAWALGGHFSVRFFFF